MNQADPPLRDRGILDPETLLHVILRSKYGIFRKFVTSGLMEVENRGTNMPMELQKVRHSREW